MQAIAVMEQSVRDRAKAYLTQAGITPTEFAKEIGYNRSTLSIYLDGKYKSDPSGIEAALTAFLDRRPNRDNRFFESRDAKNILAVCQSCQEYHEMGMITGPSGFGKTYALQTYAKLPQVVYIQCGVTMNIRDLLKSLERGLGLPTPSGTRQDRINAITEFLSSHPGYLIIVDEADKLMSAYTKNKLHVLREIFDKSQGGDGIDDTTCGLVIVGEPQRWWFTKRLISCYRQDNWQKGGNQVKKGELLQIEESKDFYVPKDIPVVLLDKLHRIYGLFLEVHGGKLSAVYLEAPD